jgi:tRNA dimethylallyltransferase
VPQELRNSLAAQYARNGLEWLQKQVLQADCDYFRTADTHNPQRLLHALEVTLAAGKPYSSFRRGTKKQRPFSVVKICLTRPREQLYARINSRVDNMLAQGLLQEAERVMPLRHLNALNTVGYKELFEYFDGSLSLDEAIFKIQSNTRRYARKQITWFKRDEAIQWFSPLQIEEVIHFISNRTQYH